MKNLNLFLFAAGAAILTACGGAKEEAATEPVVASYTLDAEASTLEWTGKKSGKEEGQHTGTVLFKGGTAETTDEVVTSGTLTLDANSINATDLEGEWQGKLNGHLKHSDFFNAEKYPTFDVKFGEIKDGKVSATVSVVGQEFTNEVPVSTKFDGDKLIVDGKFTFDFDGISSPGFTPGETSILPQIDFNIHLVFKK